MSENNQEEAPEVVGYPYIDYRYGTWVRDVLMPGGQPIYYQRGNPRGDLHVHVDGMRGQVVKNIPRPYPRAYTWPKDTDIASAPSTLSVLSGPSRTVRGQFVARDPELVALDELPRFKPRNIAPPIAHPQRQPVFPLINSVLKRWGLR